MHNDLAASQPNIVKRMFEGYVLRDAGGAPAHLQLRCRRVASQVSAIQLVSRGKKSLDPRTLQAWATFTRPARRQTGDIRATTPGRSRLPPGACLPLILELHAQADLRSFGPPECRRQYTCPPHEGARWCQPLTGIRPSCRHGYGTGVSVAATGEHGDRLDVVPDDPGTLVRSIGTFKRTPTLTLTG